MKTILIEFGKILLGFVMIMLFVLGVIYVPHFGLYFFGTIWLGFVSWFVGSVTWFIIKVLRDL